MNRKSLLSVVVVFFGVIGLGAESAASVPPGLTRAEPVLCATAGSIVLRGRYIETTGNAVEVRGPCDVTIVDSYIVAGGIGVLTSGSGDVLIENSTIEGGRGGLVVRGSGDISYRNTVVKGTTRVEGTGDIVDLGGTVSSAKAGSRGGARPGGVEIRSGRDRIVLGRGGVTIGDHRDTVTVRDGEISVTDGRSGSITAGGVPAEVTVQGRGGSVYIDGGYVRLRSGRSSVTIQGNWRSAASAYRASDTERLLLELDARAEGGQIHLDLAGDVLFDAGRATVRPDARGQLAKVAHLIRQRADGVIFVIGHTDSVGGDDYNQQLSEERAVSVMHWLDERERIPADLMRGRGMGEKEPVAHNTMPDGSDNPAGRARNRRVEIRIATGR